MMQGKRLLNYALAGFAGMLPLGLSAQLAAPPTITVLTTYDYPGAGNSTTGYGINSRGDIAGDYLDANNVRRGFVRFSNGSFSAPIVAPNDTGSFTRARGINTARKVNGDFFNVIDNSYHGFFLTGNTFTQFDIGAGLSTDLYGINDAGNFVGAYGSTTQAAQAFINIAGTTTVITIPGQYDALASGINATNQVAGIYSTNGGLNQHGFLRKSNGALTYPIDFAGATITVLNGINDLGWMVGRYDFADNIDHGLFFRPPNTFVSFDYPGSIGTSLNGINKNGLISGRYTDASGLRHSFIAQVSR